MSSPTLDLAAAAALAPKVRAITNEILVHNIGRENVVLATLLALVCGKPAFFLGVPGVNKTGTVQALARAIKEAVFFEALMPTIASVDQLLVESTSIQEKTTTDGGKEITVRQKLGRAANAHVFFADEIWKADPSVLQTLLDLSKGDGVRMEGVMHQTPLLAFLAASNELPEEGGPLEAMWSRMTIRVQVRPLDEGARRRFIAERLSTSVTSKLTRTQLELWEIKLLRSCRRYVVVPQSIIDEVIGVYDQLDEDTFAEIRSDDRRFGRVFDVLQAHALLHGRTQVTSADLTVLRWMLWNSPEQIPAVEAIVDPLCRTPFGECRELVDMLLATGGIVDQVCQGVTTQAVNALTQVNTCKRELMSKVAALSGAEATKAQAWITALGQMTSVIAMAVGGTLDRDAAQAAYNGLKSALS